MGSCTRERAAMYNTEEKEEGARSQEGEEDTPTKEDTSDEPDESEDGMEQNRRRRTASREEKAENAMECIKAVR